MLPALQLRQHNPIAVIQRSGRAESTKALYIGVLSKFLDTGHKLWDAGALVDFAGTLTDPSKRIFRAAVRLWANELIHDMEATVTPETLPRVQASVMRLHALPRMLKVTEHRGHRAHTWLTKAQVKALYDSCDDTLMGLRDKTLLGLMVTTGMRRGEVCALQWRHIIQQPYEDELLSVLNVIRGKGNKDRSIPLTPQVDQLLDEWAERIGGKVGYVCRALRNRKLGECLERGSVHHIVRKRGKMIGVPRLACHDLRRTAAQAWWDATHDLLLVSELLGHKSLETTRIYLTLDQAKKAEAVRAVVWG